MKKKSIVVFSGAGMSAESGLHTFRDTGGLWEQHKIEDVATPDAWRRDPQRVLNFYNMRFKQLKDVRPNSAHMDIAKLEENHNVHVITQNVDNLHERAGSSRVLHLHGELSKCKSSGPKDHITEMPINGLEIGMLCPDGYQLRPHVVWFGEEVPEIPRAASIVSEADALVIIGTSLNVYPAAGLVYAVDQSCEVILIDPEYPNIQTETKLTHIAKKATEGMKELFEILAQ